MKPILPIVAAAGLLAFATTAAVAGPPLTIVQSGLLAGEAGEPIEHVIEVEAFDTMGGTRELVGVTFDVLTAVIGGYQTDGSGVPVAIFAEITADYTRDTIELASTIATIDLTVPNSFPAAFTVFDNDQDFRTTNDPAELPTWTGTGLLELGAVTQLTVTEEPAGIIDFSAGGSVQWTLTYEYVEVDPCPADLDGSGAVDFEDLLSMLSAWGPCAGCPADLDDSGAVDFTDVLGLLAAWGACEG